MCMSSKVAAYIRVSTEEQVKEGFSVPAQLEACQNYCKARGWPAAVPYVDEGYTSRDTNRPAYQWLMGDITSGTVNCVLTWRQDRLTRNERDLLDLFDTFIAHSINYVSITEGFDLSNPAGRLAAKMVGAFNHYFMETLQENIRMGLHRRAREGLWISTPPTGSVVGESGALEWKGEAWRVSKAFELADSDLSLKEVSRRTGINYSTLRGVLRNKAYLGLLYCDGEWISGAHDALIDTQLFERVQKMRPVQRRDKGNNQGHNYVFSGTVRCPLCHRAMTSKRSGKGILQYGCWHRGGSPCAGTGGRASAKIERAFLASVELLKDDEVLRQELRDTWKNRKHPDFSEVLNKSVKQLELVNKKVNKCVDMMLSMSDLEDIWSQKLTSLKAQRTAIEADIDMWTRQDEQKFIRKAELDELLSRFEDDTMSVIWNEGDDEEKRAILYQFVECIYVYPEYAVIQYFNIPAFKVWWSEVDRGQVRPIMERENRAA